MASEQIDDEQLFELALFAGAGGGLLGSKLLGWRTICAVEHNAYAASVLVARQNDGSLEAFPVWDDVCSFRSDNPDCSGMFESLRKISRRLIVTAGFPCQNISNAGDGTGIDGEQSGLWNEAARIIREIQPRGFLLENSSALTSRGLHRVLGDLAEMGFDAEWGVLGANDAGFPHRRERIWIASDSLQVRKPRYFESRSFSEARQGGASLAKAVLSSDPLRNGNSWPQPLLRGVDARLARAVDRIAAIGNGQIPRVAAVAWKLLIGDGRE